MSYTIYTIYIPWSIQTCKQQPVTTPATFATRRPKVDPAWLHGQLPQPTTATVSTIPFQDLYIKPQGISFSGQSLDLPHSILINVARKSQWRCSLSSVITYMVQPQGNCAVCKQLIMQTRSILHANMWAKKLVILWSHFPKKFALCDGFRSQS